MQDKNISKKLEGGEKKMGLESTNVQMCICERCGYKWIPRQTEIPVNCPKCRSAYWNRPRIRVPSDKKTK